MPEYSSPGVYIEEFEIGAKPIEGVSTSAAGFLGETERGPTEAKLITGFEQYKRCYGDLPDTSYLLYAVEGFFRNGGQKCYIGRIVGKDSQTASLEDAPKNGNAPSPPVPISPENAESENSKTTEGPPSGGGKRKKSSKPESGGNPGKVLEIRAIGPGEWGNRVAVKIEQASDFDDNPKMFKMTVMYWRYAPPEPVVDPTDPERRKDPKRREPSCLEVYEILSCDPASSEFYETRINNTSVLIEVSKKSDGIPALTDKQQFLTGGSDGDKVALSDYKGQCNANTGERTGLEAFTVTDEISLICAPNENDLPGLSQVIVSHCELMKDRFAILQAPQSDIDPSVLKPPLRSRYAAFYCPWIKILDPQTNNEKFVPPGGYIAGIYARSDTERGVHKAPANETVRGAQALYYKYNSSEQGVLNRRGVNCLRSFPGRGIRVWGARTVASLDDSLWKYINVRRLFLFVEESIEEGTQWVVFEPNDEKLWARIRQTITQFLTTVWRSGALMGTTAEEAFFVKCDRTTMTQDDIENGRLICVIGIAPVKPAEFVIFRITQWPGGSAVTE